VTLKAGQLEKTEIPPGEDLDVDGLREVVRNDSDGFVRVLGADGKEKAKIPGGRVGWPYSLFHAPFVVDLDGDGRNEVLDGGRSRVFNCSGPEPKALESLLRRKDINPGGALTGDFDGDGQLDTLLADAEGTRAISGKDGHVIFTPAKPPESHPFMSGAPAIGDLTGDGRDDVAAVCGFHVAAWDGASGRLMWQGTSEEMCVNGRGAMADLDGDGKLDAVIVGGYAINGWDGATGRQFFSINSRGQKGRYEALADMDGDGASEVGFASAHGKFYCFDGATGLEKWIFEIPGHPDFSNPCAADIDGDGKMEYLLGCMDGKLYCLNGEDGSQAWTFDFGAAVGDPVVADTDNDGIAEILVVADGYLVCLEE
jgi:outer membrane protein assembly factor BamB